MNERMAVSARCRFPPRLRNLCHGHSDAMSPLTTDIQKTGRAISACAILLLCLALVLACDHQAVPEAAPRPTPTLTQTASPSATPTLDPTVRVDRAYQALHDGSYETSIVLFREALGITDEEGAQELTVALARAYFAAGRYDELIRWLNSSGRVDKLAGDDQAIVLGLLARSYDALGEWSEVISAYERYLELDDAAAYQVRQRIAYVYESLGEPEEALQQLQTIDTSDLDTRTRAAILEHQADLFTELRDRESALACLDEVLSFAQRDYYRASVSQRKGETLLEMGRADEGIAVLHEVLDRYPETWGAYLSLLALDEIDMAEITALQRGQLLYHAWQCEESILTLERYRLDNPSGHWSTAHYYAGLAYHRLGQYEEAIDEFDIVIRRFPRSDVAGDAWIAKARSVAASGGNRSEIYRAFVESCPDHARAPEALWRAAEWLERCGDWKEAAAFYHDLRVSYPNDSGADEAFFREGLAAYALGNQQTALDTWTERLQNEATTGAISEPVPVEDQARWLTWMGLASARLGDEDVAQSHWEKAARIAPDRYYGLRAQDLMREEPLRLPTDTPAVIPITRIKDSDWHLIERWISTWAQTNSEPAPPVEEQLLVRRGRALWQLGRHAEATDAYRLFADEIRDQPEAILGLATHCHANDVHAMTIWCAVRLLWLGDQAGAGDPPRSLLNLSYPTTYAHLIQEEAERHNVDPLLFLALIRQESQFDPYVISWAGAVGLAQIMPETGVWIAERLGAELHDDDLLLRPVVSVRYGVWYLSWALDLFDRHWPTALAAYNAGATNVFEWTNGEAVSDPDLFYEMIPLPETKAYLELIYEHYRNYQRIYGTGTTGNND